MFDSLLSLLAPHHCYSCGISWSLLCQSCLYDIIQESVDQCAYCLKVSTTSLCRRCRSKLPYSGLWIASKRDGAIKQLLDDFKFQRTYHAYKSASHLLDLALPEVSPKTIVTSIPTISRHIRMRGYDHAALIAKAFAKQRKLQYRQVLNRKENTIQHTAKNLKIRQTQAEKAFYVAKPLDRDKTYLVIDDIFTSGATVKVAAGLLKEAGAKEVFVGVVARQ